MLHQDAVCVPSLLPLLLFLLLFLLKLTLLLHAVIRVVLQHFNMEFFFEGGVMPLNPNWFGLIDLLSHRSLDCSCEVCEANGLYVKSINALR